MIDQFPDEPDLISFFGAEPSLLGSMPWLDNIITFDVWRAEHRIVFRFDPAQNSVDFQCYHGEARLIRLTLHNVQGVTFD